MKKTIEVEICDLCKEKEEDLESCEVCKKEFCDRCAPDEHWQLGEFSLCSDCLDKVTDKIPGLIEKMKEEIK